MEGASEILGNLHYTGLFVLLIMGGVGFPFPEDATLILCGLLISAGNVKAAPAIATVYAGLLIADAVLYVFGRRYGRYVITRRWFHGLLSPEKLARLEERFKRRGVLLIVVGRHIIGLRAQILLVAGIMRMSFLKFILSDALTASATVAVMVYIGYAGGENLPEIKRYMRDLREGVFIAALAVIGGYFLYKYIKGRKNKTA